MPASRPDRSSNARFPTTRWSQVVAAGDRADPAARAALDGFCAAYWYPLHAFVRRKGHSPDEAVDVVQGTFVTLLDRDGLAAVAPADELTPERLFDRRWATSLLDHAVARLEAELLAAGKAALVSRLLPTPTGGRGEVAYAAISAELGMTEGGRQDGRLTPEKALR